MIRPLVSIIAGAAAFAAVADLRETPIDKAEQTDFAQACRYYDMRAQAVSATRRGEFVVFLSEACSVAQKLLESGSREQQMHSAFLLSRVAKLRMTVAEINAERARMFAATPDEPAAGYLPVSPSGEFLIAHRLGVLLAYDAWLDTGVQFSVASYP